MKNTSFLEGDIIRFFRQMMDRFSQIKKATNDMRLQQMVKSCQDLIINSLSDIDKI